jgi:ABC-type phosphate/phosphonate transport system substrate-binding protein
MGKLVFLKLEVGDFNQGFKVILDIAEEGLFPHIIGVSGCLRPAPEVAKFYRDWQTKYCRLESNYRRKRLYFTDENFAEEEGKEENSIQECYEAAEKFKASFRDWLKCEEFRPIEAELFTDLSKSDEIRVILKTEDELLRKLPWEVWNFFQRFPNAELGISPLYSYKQRQFSTPNKVKILAILGNSDGINTQEDKNILEGLPCANVCFLVEPTREQFRSLWEDQWDILFFAGHSSSKDGQKGYIYINRTDDGKLEISELEETLRTAIGNGLKLAIFNSCDGLGLARQLERLHIPQVIVMREPVPDKVAQEFLKYFLTDLSRGLSLYASVRRARSILQELLQIDQKFPGASWLPVICQNPAAKDFIWPSPWLLPSGWRKRAKHSRQHSHVAIISGLVGGAIAVIAIVWLSSFTQAPCSVATEKREAGVCVKDLSKKSLIIGFLSSPHQPMETTDEYQYLPLQNYLKKSFGGRVKTISTEIYNNMSYQKMQSLISNKELDIVFAHSPMNSWVAKKNGYIWLGSHNPSSSAYYRSVLFVRASSPIQSTADVKATTRVALGHVGSASSFYVPVYDLYGKNLSVTLVNSHREIQELVRTGKVDVGASTESDIEKQSEFRIIHYSRAIPVAGVFISPKLSESDRNQIQQIFRQAPREIIDKARYQNNIEEPNYDYIGQISVKTEEIINCANFNYNPVQFFCNQ